MPQPRHPAGNGENFVRHVVADPKNVPDVMLLYGYLGASSEEGHERVYLSPDLSNYVDVPAASILHRAQSSTEHDPLGGVMLWIKKDTALKYKMAPAQQAAQQQLAAYFAGALQAGGGAAQAGIAALPQTAPPAACPIITIAHTCLPHASCGATCVATCQATCHATCPPHATCGATCIATCVQSCAATCVATCVQSCAATCAATCAVTCAATCQVTCAAGCTGHATCAQICTHITPCVTRGQPDCPFPSEIPAQCTHAVNCVRPQAQAAMGAGAQIPCIHHTQVPPTFPIICTNHVTCAPVCTHFTPCIVTHGQPDCPFPSEICTHAVHCVQPQAGPHAAMGAAAQMACALGTIAASVQIPCSIACPTRFATCTPECGVTRHPNTCNPQCWITRYWTCNFECQITHNPDLCPVAGPGGGPVEQAQLCIAGSVRPPQVTVFCTVGAACQSLVCPSWQYSCGWGCPPRTPQCPW